MSEVKERFALSKEQQKIVDAMMDQQVFVRAGAGTGKTATMVEGIVDKLRNCPDALKPDFFNHVFMVTFTDNAAAELKTRLRNKLLKDENPIIRKQADRVEDAWVSTIHGLCSRILKMYAIEAGVDQNFTVCSGAERAVLLQQACDEVSSELREKPEYRMLFSFYGYEKQGDRGSQSASEMAFNIAEKLTESIDSNAVQWVTYDDEAIQAAIDTYPKKIYDRWTQLSELYLANKPTAKGEAYLYGEQEKLEKLKPAFQKDASLEEKLYVSAQLPVPSGTYFKKDEYKIYKEEIEEKKTQFLFCLAFRIFFEGLQAPLYEFAKKIKRRFDELKENAGLLDNNDLLEKCYTFLREKKPAICHSFVLAIVDEFQDTNEQQLEIIKLLAKDKNALCFVGDAQQSIYRFRGADIDLYNRIREEIEEKDRTKDAKEQSIFDLSTNYRSHVDILSFVERITNNPSVLKDFLSLSIPKNIEKEPSEVEEYIRKSPLWDGKRILVEYTLTKGIGASSRYKPANASQVAERIAEIINESKGLVKPKDIAVLTRTTKDVDRIARALHEVNCDAMRVNQKNKNVAEFDEIHHLLIALANPADTKNGVLPLLTGPMFEIPYDDFVLVAKGSEVVHLPDFFIKSSKEVKDEMDDELDERTYRAFDVLSSLRSLRKQLSVVELVEYACIQSGWLARISMDSQGRTEKAANLFTAFSVIREIVDDAGFGLSSAPELFSLWRKDEKGRAALLNSSEKGAVTVETVYQSKGLQYPIVVLSGDTLLNPWAPNYNLFMASFEGKTYMTFKISFSDRQLYHSVTERLLSKVSGSLDSKVLNLIQKSLKFKMPEYSEEKVLKARKELKENQPVLPCKGVENVRIVEDEADKAESWRLLYVAMTRAENGLIVCMPQNIKKEDEVSDMSLFMNRFNDVLNLPGELTQAEYDFDLGSLDVHIRKDVLEGGGKSAPDETLVKTPELEPFIAFEENDKPLPKIPWGYMQDVGSFSADSHQAEEIAGQDEDGEELTQALDLKDRKRAAQEIINSIAGKPAFEFGTAFHSLAQLAALQRAKPTAQQITARAKFHDLDARRTKELEQAVEAWWESPLREEAYAMTYLEPEYPFFMVNLQAEDAEGTTSQNADALGANSQDTDVAAIVSQGAVAAEAASQDADAAATAEAGGQAAADLQGDIKPYKRGFIDLLAYDKPKGRALVVDYKTGEEKLSEEEARLAHEKQCGWYARALLDAGFEEVAVKFVLVQNLQTDGTPLVVDFGTYTE